MFPPLQGETAAANFFARIEPYEPERSKVEMFAIAAELPLNPLVLRSPWGRLALVGGTRIVW